MRTVSASQPTPPATANDGDCFRVTSPATLAWAGCEDRIAIHIGGDWHFVAPHEGMPVFDQAAGHILVFRSEWELASAPAIPSGGSVIDIEARAAIEQLIEALQAIGMLGEAGA
jgi:hypothetical protein